MAGHQDKRPTGGTSSTGSSGTAKTVEEQAIAEILKDAARGKERSKTMGVEGWRKPQAQTNREFLRRTIGSVLSHERHKNKSRSSRTEKRKDNTRHKDRSPSRSHMPRKHSKSTPPEKKRRKDPVEVKDSSKSSRRKSDRKRSKHKKEESNPDLYNEPEAHHEVPLDHNLKVMFGRAAKVTKYLSEMKIMMLQLQYLHDRVLTSSSFREEGDCRDEMTAIGNRFSALARKCKSVLKRFEIPESDMRRYSAASIFTFNEKSNREDIEMVSWSGTQVSWHRLNSGTLLPLSNKVFIPAEVRMTFHLHNLLTYKLTNLVRDYYTMQKIYGDKCKEKIKRQMSIIGREMDEQEIEEAIHRQEQIPLLHKEISDDTVVDRQMQLRLREVEVLHKELLDLEKSIEELYKSFLTISTLVHEQGAIVDRIEQHVSLAADYVEDSTQLLKKASGFQHKYRKKKLLLIVILIVAITIIIIIIVVSIKKKHQSTTKVVIEKSGTKDLVFKGDGG